MTFVLSDGMKVREPAELRNALRSGLIEVTFLKKSTGEKRVMNSTLSSHLIPEGKTPDSGDGSKSNINVTKSNAVDDNADLIAVYVPKVEGWRSFYWGNVLDIKRV